MRILSVAAVLPSGPARRPVLLMALGTFALGTDTFVISGVRPPTERQCLRDRSPLQRHAEAAWLDPMHLSGHGLESHAPNIMKTRISVYMTLATKLEHVL